MTYCLLLKNYHVALLKGVIFLTLKAVFIYFEYLYHNFVTYLGKCGG